jgi:hypothetical protein
MEPILVKMMENGGNPCGLDETSVKTVARTEIM